MARITLDPVPWWLVPNVLSLDAPLVAVVWQRFLAGRFGVPVPAAATLALAAVVWAVYLADRYLDARRGAVDADRHRLAGQFPFTFVAAILFAVGVAVVAISSLPVSYFRAGGVVGSGVAGYLIFVHLVVGHGRRLPGAKELLVGIGFAAGVGIPLAISDPPATRWLPSVVAFGGLCWLNCRLIDRWETAVPTRPLWPDAALAVTLAVGSLALPLAIGLAVAVGVGGLFLVHGCCRHRPRAARVLADGVLLSPLFAWVVP